ncbi:MAG: thioredoxin-like domain-containing protein [Planctomycetota bacterium]|nr:thioredoxin-like domain-containing protein [Planctomycetota bacterium]
MRNWMAPLAVLVLLASGVRAEDKDPWKEMFPEGLHDAAGNAVDPATLKGKIVGLYFSAHWCPPCKVFTPMLVKFRDENQKDFEVVFVSSDKTADAQKEYMTETKMQWPTLKWRGNVANGLAKTHEIRGIPALVILGPDGKVLSKNGRGDVTSDAAGAIAKWKAAAGQ